MIPMTMVRRLIIWPRAALIVLGCVLVTGCMEAKMIAGDDESYGVVTTFSSDIPWKTVVGLNEERNRAG